MMLHNYTTWLDAGLDLGGSTTRPGQSFERGFSGLLNDRAKDDTAGLAIASRPGHDGQANQLPRLAPDLPHAGPPS